MLQHLTIKHYALIEHLDIDFKSGFTVITGETGAGKSIMLGALNLLLGGRADAKSIQANEKKCMVEASFQIQGLGLEHFFANNDIDYDATDCIIRREVMQTGKSRAFINDTPVTAAKLKELGSALIDIHSQHQNLLIRNEHFLIDTLDVMAAQPQLVSGYKCLYSQCRQAELALKQLQEKAAKGQADQEFMTFQLSQLDEAQLQNGEQEELESEQHLLEHAEEIKEKLARTQGLLSNDEWSISQCLRQAAECLDSITDNLPQASSLAERIRSARIELDDIESEVESEGNQIEYDPARLNFVEERLSLIYNLEQRHQVQSVNELLSIAEQLRQSISAIDNIDDNIRLQAQEVCRLQVLRDKTAANLTQSRRKAAQMMQRELTETLQLLGMPNARIEIAITPRPIPDVTGADQVVFNFSANKNVPLQDVSAIASGGEIARLMLALKRLIAQRTALPTIVFDEIDTGVSGTMAECMAQVMKQISEHCQVLCITHLPQIAAMGSNHLRVFKEDSAGTTHSHIEALNERQRIEEIAHMLSGVKLTDAAIENAKALISK